MPPSLHLKFRGFLFAFITVTIWAGWIIVTRLGTRSNLSPLDITFLRFTTAGILLFPIAFKNRAKILQTPKTLLFFMLLGAGAPYVAVSALGFRTAPASHGILIPGTMPLWVALLSHFFFKEKFGDLRLGGYTLILCGMLLKLHSSSIEGLEIFFHDTYFLFAAILWAIYTMANRKAGLSPLVAASWVTVGSCLSLLPFYLIYQWQNPYPLQFHGALLQILYQGILTSIVSLITYNYASQTIGVSRSSAFAALIPAMVTALAIPFLGEEPTIQDLVFVGLMTVGVLLASNVLVKKDKGIKDEKI